MGSPGGCGRVRRARSRPSRLDLRRCTSRSRLGARGDRPIVARLDRSRSKLRARSRSRHLRPLDGNPTRVSHGTDRRFRATSPLGDGPPAPCTSPVQRGSRAPALASEGAASCDEPRPRPRALSDRVRLLARGLHERRPVSGRGLARRTGHVGHSALHHLATGSTLGRRRLRAPVPPRPRGIRSPGPPGAYGIPRLDRPAFLGDLRRGRRRSSGAPPHLRRASDFRRGEGCAVSIRGFRWAAQKADIDGARKAATPGDGSLSRNRSRLSRHSADGDWRPKSTTTG